MTKFHRRTLVVGGALASLGAPAIVRAQFNMEILASPPEDFTAYQKSEQERWFKVIKENDIKGD